MGTWYVFPCCQGLVGLLLLCDSWYTHQFLFFIVIKADHWSCEFVQLGDRKIARDRSFAADAAGPVGRKALADLCRQLCLRWPVQAAFATPSSKACRLACPGLVTREDLPLTFSRIFLWGKSSERHSMLKSTSVHLARTHR